MNRYPSFKMMKKIVPANVGVGRVLQSIYGLTFFFLTRFFFRGDTCRPDMLQKRDYFMLKLFCDGKKKAYFI